MPTNMEGPVQSSDQLSTWDTTVSEMPAWLREITEKGQKDNKRHNAIAYRYITVSKGKLAFFSAEHATDYNTGKLKASTPATSTSPGTGYSFAKPCPSATYPRTTTALPDTFGAWCVIAPEEIENYLVSVRTWITDSIDDEEERLAYISAYPDVGDLLIQLRAESDDAALTAATSYADDLEKWLRAGIATATVKSFTEGLRAAPSASTI